jgi:tight adherence protein B
MDLIISSCIFAFILAISLVVLTSGRSGRDRTRIRELLEMVTRDADEQRAIELIRVDPRRRANGSAAFAALARLKPLQRLEQTLWQAGLYLHVSEMLLIMVLATGVGLAAGQLATGDMLLASAAAVGLGALPLLYVRWRGKRRMRAFTLQLPAALDLMRSSLEAGHTLLRALQVLIGDCGDPLASEFRIVLEQARLGMSLPRAFDELVRRVPVEDLRLLVIAIKVQSEVGSALAQLLSRLAEIIRARQNLQGQIHAMTSQGRMSGMVVGLLPLFVLAAFSLIQPNYVHVLFYDPTGIKVVKAAVALDAMAFFTIRRILAVQF